MLFSTNIKSLRDKRAIRMDVIQIFKVLQKQNIGSIRIRKPQTNMKSLWDKRAIRMDPIHLLECPVGTIYWQHHIKKTQQVPQGLNLILPCLKMHKPKRYSPSGTRILFDDIFYQYEVPTGQKSNKNGCNSNIQSPIETKYWQHQNKKTTNQYEVTTGQKVIRMDVIQIFKVLQR